MRNCVLLGHMNMCLTAQLLNGYNVLDTEELLWKVSSELVGQSQQLPNEDIDGMRMLIGENPHISIRSIAWKLGVSYGTVNSIIHEELKMKK